MLTLSQPRYRLAGTLAMLNALLTIPWFIVTFLLTDREWAWLKLAEAFMQTSSVLIFIFTSLSLKKLLNIAHGFHETDRHILWLIKLNFVLLAVSLTGLISPSFASSAGIVSLLFVVPLGVVQLLLGVKLQKLPSDLGGLLRPYCYLNMVTGFSLAAIILLPLGILTGAIADIMLGTIFFQSAVPGRLVDTEV